MAMEKAPMVSFNKAIVESGSNLVGHLSKEELPNTKELPNLVLVKMIMRKMHDIPSSVLLKAMKKRS